MNHYTLYANRKNERNILYITIRITTITIIMTMMMMLSMMKIIMKMWGNEFLKYEINRASPPTTSNQNNLKGCFMLHKYFKVAEFPLFICLNECSFVRTFVYSSVCSISEASQSGINCYVCFKENNEKKGNNKKKYE